MAQQYTKEKFEIIKVNELNEDGTSRQDLLKKFLYTDEDELTFNRGPVREDNHQLVEAMVKGQKVGELSDDDYRRYNAMIRVAKDARIQIYEEEEEDGTHVFTAEAVLVVPYAVSVESRKELNDRKRLAIGTMSIVFLVLAVWLLFKGEFKSAILGVIIAAVMAWWGFIRKPEKDDVVMKYIETGKKGRTW
ncbi:MAG: hypothetical protein II918_04465 [Firmicutes bacterium]|nr:hypothetical protein [Bacillota bacterium]